MHELSRLFQQVDELVAEQDVPLQLIDEQGERVQEDVQKANVQLDTANRTARSRNKKKWICLAIASEYHHHTSRSTSCPRAP